MMRFLLFPCLESQGIHAHLLHHRHEAVAAGGGEVLLQSYLVDEVEVGIENLLRCGIAQHTDEQRDDAFHDERIALC